MGILYLLIVAVMFSFGGTWAKLIGPFFDAGYITFFRFFFGVFFLLLLKMVKRQRFQADYWQQIKKLFPWLVFGGVSKVLAYLTENYGLLHGVSYGAIMTQPAQTVFLTAISAFVLKEKITWKKAVFILPCILGVMLVSWNGRSLDDYLSGNLLVSLLFLVSGVFAGCHVFAQKKVAGKMDILDSNLTMFLISTVIAFLPILPPTLQGQVAGVRPDWGCILAMLMFGVNTGIGFYLNAMAIPLVPFYMVPIIQSTMAIFSIIWGMIFFHEPISVYVVVGTLTFIGGIVGLQVAGKEKKGKENRTKGAAG